MTAEDLHLHSTPSLNGKFLCVYNVGNKMERFLNRFSDCSVSVRVRPLSEVEAEKGSAWRIEGNTIHSVGRDAADGGYSLDNVFDSSWSTEAVYKHTTKDLVKKVVGGFNGTVFAYGQTSSGKTHTMRGTASDPGIVPLAVEDIFNHIASTLDREYLVRVSYMEVSYF